MGPFWTTILVALVALALGACVTRYPTLDRPTAGVLLDDADAGFERSASPSPLSRALTPEGLALLKLNEGQIRCRHSGGLRHCPYNDSSGYCTIGRGYLIEKRKCEAIGDELKALSFDKGINEERAEEILKDDLERVQRTLE